MGLRELLILLLILAIVAVVLRGLYVALHSRRNQLRVALTRNVPEYDLEELELSELPGGGARQVERSFERVMQQNSAYDAAEEAGVGTEIPVLTETADPESDFDSAPEHDPQAQPEPEPRPAPRSEPEPEQTPRRKASTDFGEDEHDALDGHVFVDDYDSEYDDEDYDDDLDDRDDDDDELDDELDEALNELLDDEVDPVPPPRPADSQRREPASSRYTDLAADADWLDEDGDGEEEDVEEPVGGQRDTDAEPDVFGEDGYEIEELTLAPEDGPPMDEPRVEAASSQPESGPEPGPEPGPENETAPEPISARDDFDILLDGYEEERAQRMEELESRQDTASRRFMQWAGERVGRAGGLLRSGPGSSSADPRPDRAARKAEQREERQTAQRTAAAARAEQARQEQSELDLFEDEPLDNNGPAAPEAAETRTPRGGRESAGKATRRSETSSSPREQETASGANNNVDPEYSEVLVINVMAPPDQLIHGDELLPVLLGAGLRFGDMNIFHRHAHGKSGPVLFSVANVLNPGTFDLNEMHDFATRGLCFFLTLPNAINNMQAFEHMLQTARQVCDALDAELKDDYRSVMTAQTIEHYRERVREFELRQLRQEASRQ